MNPARFGFALERLRPSDWKQFEEVASEFLAAEFPNLRTTAASTGDRGRDAELFSPIGRPSVLLQYSVTKSWESKIRDTVATITEHHPDAAVLIYVSNQDIGPEGDGLKVDISQNHRLYLDIRDRSWFVERVNTDSATEAAAERLAVLIADPYLEARGVASSKSVVFDSVEARTAVLHLDLQLRDDVRDKGLTKLSFDGLVRAALRGTDPDHRLKRNDVVREVNAYLPSHSDTRVAEEVNASLARLNKKFVRHYQSSDEFCLVHSERVRLRDRLAELEQSDNRVTRDLGRRLRAAAKKHRTNLPEDASDVIQASRRLLELVLVRKGENFVDASSTGNYRMFSEEELREIVVHDRGTSNDDFGLGPHYVPVIADAVEDVLLDPSPEVQVHLRGLADAYTLFAFLRETPDVQKVVKKMFSHGDIWLDTSILLPLFAETLVGATERRYSTLLLAAREAGLSLAMTPGVLEEVERHMNRCLACARRTVAWEGRLPFLLVSYTMTGRAPGSFSSWLETFRGGARPEDDIADYLRHEFGVQVRDLTAEFDSAPDALRYSVLEAWRAIHDERRKGSRLSSYDPASLSEILAKHDAENFLGVLQRRKNESSSPFGYSSWWLTLDRNAPRVLAKIRDEYDQRLPGTPLLSPDFLLNYLALGPIRQHIPKDMESQLPVMLDVSRDRVVPPELLEEAEKIRGSLEDQPEHVIQRRTRDGLDAAKARRGALATSGFEGMAEDLKKDLRHQASGADGRR